MMERASREARYENAAYYRDQLKSLRENEEIDRVKPSGFEDTDVVGFHRESERYEFTVLLSRGGSVVDKLDFSAKSFHGEETEALREFLGRFYFSDHYVPRRILLPVGIRDADAYSEWFTEKRGKRVYIETPRRGQKKELVRLAVKNARESFSRKGRGKGQGDIASGKHQEIRRAAKGSLHHRVLRRIEHTGKPDGGVAREISKRQARKRQVQKIQDNGRRGTGRLPVHVRGRLQEVAACGGGELGTSGPHADRRGEGAAQFRLAGASRLRGGGRSRPGVHSQDRGALRNRPDLRSGEGRALAYFRTTRRAYIF